MPTSKNIENLVRFVANNNLELFKKEVEKIVIETRQKKHIIAANRIAKNLRTIQLKHHRNFDNDEALNSYLIERKPDRDFDTLILDQKTKAICDQLIEEHNRASLLQSYGVEPNHRILLCGDSGNGKTTLAEVLAFELSIPFYIVKYESLIDSLLGKTSKSMGSIFEFANQRKCVLFFDELDIIAKDRGSSNESGEIKRTLNSLLLQMDRLSSHVLFITATNYDSLLDSALDRRFQIKINLSKPNKKQKEQYLNMFQKNNDFKFCFKDLSSKLGKMSFAEIEQFCLDVFKKSILQTKLDNPKSIVAEAIKKLKQK